MQHQPPGGWGPQAYAPRPEHTFFQNGDVVVTSARAVIFNTTYALANITSVREWFVPKSKWPIAFGVTFVALSLLPILAHAFDWAAVAILIGALFFLFYRFLSKDQFFVRLGTASGEADALMSHDAAYVRTIVAALNDAIIHRG